MNVNKLRQFEACFFLVELQLMKLSPGLILIVFSVPHVPTCGSCSSEVREVQQVNKRRWQRGRLECRRWWLELNRPCTLSLRWQLTSNLWHCLFTLLDSVERTEIEDLFSRARKTTSMLFSSLGVTWDLTLLHLLSIILQDVKVYMLSLDPYTEIKCLPSDACQGPHQHIKLTQPRKDCVFCHKMVFISAPDRHAVPFRGPRHESITTLSTGHLRVSYLPWAPPIHYSDGHVSGDEEKSGDLHWSFAASHLGSLTGSCKRQERQLLSSLGEDEPLPTDQLFHSLNWQPVPFFLKEAIVCVCLVWKRSIFVQYSSEDVARLVWGKFVFHLFVEEAQRNKCSDSWCHHSVQSQTAQWFLRGAPSDISLNSNVAQVCKTICEQCWGTCLQNVIY